MLKSPSNWLEEEETRADEQLTVGTTSNPDADVIKFRKKVKKVERPVKGLRIRLDLQYKLEDLILVEKRKKGKSGPELADEAMKLLFDKYGVRYKD